MQSINVYDTCMRPPEPSRGWREALRRATYRGARPYSQAVASKRTEEARERLLAAANQLFYAEGVHTVGIDRVIEHAGVAKATLYSAFGSKDELIRAYLGRRYEGWQARMTEVLAGYETPRDRLLGVFDWMGEVLKHPDFHGCAFMNATAEDRPGGPTHDP